MKKIISIMLVAILLFSLSACKNNTNEETTATTQPVVTGDGPESLKETVPIDVESLKNNWVNGELIIGDVSVTIPCTTNEFIEKTGFVIANQNVLGEKMLNPDETFMINIVNESVSFRIKVRNNNDEGVINYMDADVVCYEFNNTNTNNRQIKLAGTLSPGASRTDVEQALGVPKGQNSGDTIYTYKGRNSKNKKVELTVSFNSYNVANSVSYEIKY